MSPDSRSGRAWSALPNLALLVLAGALCIQQIRSYDYWWHLRTGQLIWETGAVPRVDPFSYTAMGSSWIDVHWLFQVALFGVFNLGGHTAVIVAQLLLILVLLVVVRYSCGRPDRGSLQAAALGLMLVVVISRVMPRPELPSFVLLAAVLALFERFERTGDAWIYALVPIHLIWANFHGLFAVGLAVVGIYVSAELIRLLLPADGSPERGGPQRKARLRRLLVVGALAAMASLVNPNTVDVPLYALSQLGMIGVDRHAGLASLEIQSLPSVWQQLSPFHMASFATLAVLSGLAFASAGRRVRVADVLLWGTFLVLAVAGHRNMALFAIVATPILVRNAAERLDRTAPRPALRPLAAVLVTVLLVAVSIDAQRGRFFERLGIPRAPGFGVVEVMFPMRAADWIAANHPPGPIAHHMSDGGYLIWRLYPEYPVMVDGRLEVYGGEKNLRLRLPNPEKFYELDRRYRFGTVLVRFIEYHQGNLLGVLYGDPGWKLVFTDDVAAIFVRASGGADFPAVDVRDPNLFPPLRNERASVYAYRNQARARFYAAVGQRDLERRILRDSRAR